MQKKVLRGADLPHQVHYYSNVGDRLPVLGDEERETWKRRLAPHDKSWWHERLARLVNGQVSFAKLDKETPAPVRRCKLLLAAGVREELRGSVTEALTHYQAAEEMGRPADLACALASTCAASIAAAQEE